MTVLPGSRKRPQRRDICLVCSSTVNGVWRKEAGRHERLLRLMVLLERTRSKSKNEEKGWPHTKQIGLQDMWWRRARCGWFVLLAFYLFLALRFVLPGTPSLVVQYIIDHRFIDSQSKAQYASQMISLEWNRSCMILPIQISRLMSEAGRTDK